MKKLVRIVALIGAGVLVWRAWQQNQVKADAWASATDRLR